MLTRLVGLVVVFGALQVSRQGSHTISGRVQDGRGLLAPGVTLALCTLDEQGGSGCLPLDVKADGSFRTQSLADGTYVLQAGPSMMAPSHDPSIERGLEVVRVSGRDLTAVAVRTSRYSLRGRYVMKSDNRAAEWPPHIHLTSRLVIDGDEAYAVGESGSTGAANGEFLLENLLGPRVLRAGYQLRRDKWWPWQVLLDGIDITDTPTDFSQHQNGRLEFVFTQHPARITGQVVDANGRPATGAWVAQFSADRALWKEWASTTTKSQAVADGRFSFAVRPGRYLVAALAPTPYQVRPTWPSFDSLAATATEVTVGDRGTADAVVRLPR